MHSTAGKTLPSRPHAGSSLSRFAANRAWPASGAGPHDHVPSRDRPSTAARAWSSAWTSCLFLPFGWRGGASLCWCCRAAHQAPYELRRHAARAPPGPQCRAGGARISEALRERFLPCASIGLPAFPCGLLRRQACGPCPRAGAILRSASSTPALGSVGKPAKERPVVNFSATRRTIRRSAQSSPAVRGGRGNRVPPWRSSATRHSHR